MRNISHSHVEYRIVDHDKQFDSEVQLLLRAVIHVRIQFIRILQWIGGIRYFTKSLNNQRINETDIQSIPQEQKQERVKSVSGYSTKFM